MNKIDTAERDFQGKYPGIIETLLMDRTTKKNIIWATNNYERYGFYKNHPITLDVVSRKKNRLIKPRINKSQIEQKRRSKELAEVFTPSWICNKQNNIIDDGWFGYKNSFNIESDNSWETVDKVLF